MYNVFISLGSNLGDSLALLLEALEKINELPHIFNLKVSHFYRTTPVGNRDQNDFINAVCQLSTELDAHELLHQLQKIEKMLGKNTKRKNEPRKIDLDLIFFGLQRYTDEKLTVPHPYWQERLFVLVPLADLVEEIEVPQPDGSLTKINLKAYIKNFSNPHHEKVVRIKGTKGGLKLLDNGFGI